MSATIADIAWPGPRPLSFPVGASAESSLRRLVGRERELEELLHLCQTYAVIEVTAPSGVGKTSFVAGAITHLETEGAIVLKARPWSDVLRQYKALGAAVTESCDPIPLYCLALGQDPRGSREQIRAMLEELADERPLVCVFDQLEELLRYGGRVGTRLLELIAQVAAMNGVPHVVVARSEYRDNLRPLEIPEAPTWHMLLKPLSDSDVIRRVIEEPVPPGVELEQGFTDRLVEWWEAAQSIAETQVALGTPQGTWEYGLLHLQALLWALREWAVATLDMDRRHLGLDDLEAYAQARGLDADPEAGAALMADGLCGSFEHAIAQCESERWPAGPRLMFARAVSHLSASGFKVPQPFSSLVVRTMQEELGSSRTAAQWFDAFARRDYSLEQVADHFQIEGSGVGGNLEPYEVANEMTSSLETALNALADEEGANILRRYVHGEDPIFELVHDGAAPALQRWAYALLEEPIASLGGITARRGDYFDHDLSPEVFLVAGRVPPEWGAVSVEERQGRTFAVLHGIKWYGLGVHRVTTVGEDDPDQLRFDGLVFKDCILRGTVFKETFFRNVVFDRCDLRGVAGFGCTFENVSFDRCQLTGAVFNSCFFDGVYMDCAGVPGAMSNVTVADSAPGGRVELRDVEGTEGLFLSDLGGGHWLLENVCVAHLSIASDAEDIDVRIGGESVLEQVTFRLPNAEDRLAIGPDVRFVQEPPAPLSPATETTPSRGS